MTRGESTAAALLIAVSILTSPAAAGEIGGPTLTAVPETALVDEPVKIAVTGCAAGQVVVLRAVTFDDDGVRWESRATFEADAEGRVDPASLAPINGTYDGVDPMGLFWSMVSDEGSGNMFASDELDPLEIVLQVEIDGEVRESRRLTRRRILPSVTRREIRDRGLVGTLFLPRAEGPVGAVVVLGGSGGGLDEGTAALLASRGFASLALAYFDEESLPEDLVEIPLEYFETAIDLLGEQDAIDADRIAVQGISRGGELALLLGATFPQVRAVVAVVPSGVVWSGCCSPEAFSGPAWTYRGDPITPLAHDENDPEVKAHRAKEAEESRAGEPAALTPGFRLQLEKATNLEAATIPVERTRGPILFISGEADDLWPSTELAEISVRRLRENEFPFRFEHSSYQDAGHVFEHPFLPNVPEAKFLFGGTLAGNARAAADSWSRILAFYEEALGR
jgi:dienelactone hydrolase